MRALVWLAHRMAFCLLVNCSVQAVPFRPAPIGGQELERDRNSFHSVPLLRSMEQRSLYRYKNKSFSPDQRCENFGVYSTLWNSIAYVPEGWNAFQVWNSAA